jgi:hypothetical protein
MKHLKSFNLFESRNWKSIPGSIWESALEELKSKESINNVDELFSFYDYWLNVSEPSSSYDPERLREELDYYYSSPPTADEEWFPMWTSDSDTVEYIMHELSRIYADHSFREGEKNCHKCNQVFTQTNRNNPFCSSRCERDYDEAMSLGQW